ncbi:hypothetical protein KACHI17_06880 [Sediminibacterium sp. KACHI17]|jgi:uncharacterized protein|uniref:YCII-related domain-containing protein n=1 Tax=Sediminibacterium sp. KACHI17 TaxID=1751071 RepID=A0AAT9GH34_9BACT
MKKVLLLVFLAAICSIANAQNNPKPEEQIRKYWFVLLLKGPVRNQDSATAAKIQRGHLDNMDKMYYDGKLKVAGPFGDGKDWQGIFIFDCATKEEVENLLKTDPAIAAGRLIADIRPWYTAPTGSFVPGKPKS